MSIKLNLVRGCEDCSQSSEASRDFPEKNFPSYS